MAENAKLIKDFIAEWLHGNIDALKAFNFKELENDKKYGCSGRGFDCDDTNLARAIYCLVWQDVLPELNMESLAAGKKYRGETLNTAKTLFGFEPEYEKQYQRAAKFSDDIVFFNEIDTFRNKFFTVGNFMPLPNYTLPGSRTTINTYRSWGKWCDFFDKFLLELNKCFVDDKDKDEGLARLIKENSHYFDYFANDMQKFSQVNFLEPYFAADGKVELLPFNYDYPKQCVHIKNPTEEQKEEYVKNGRAYIARATNIIDYRTDKIIKVLKSKLV